MTTEFVIVTGLKGVITRAWAKPQSTPDEICSAMRNCKVLGHEDVITMLACFASMLQKPSAISDKFTNIVVDMLDEVSGQIEQDQIDQQAEQMWLDSQRVAT